MPRLADKPRNTSPQPPPLVEAPITATAAADSSKTQKAVLHRFSSEPIPPSPRSSAPSSDKPRNLRGSLKTLLMAGSGSAIGFRHALADCSDRGSGRMDASLKSTIGFRHALSNRRRNSSNNDNDDPSQLQEVKTNNAAGISVEELEAEVLEQCQPSSLRMLQLNFLATIRVFLRHLITLEALLASCLAAAVTTYWYFDIQSSHKHDVIPKDGTLDRMLLTFAVIVPMSASIRMAFNRRERALQELSRFRSFCHHIYTAHATWDWVRRDGGRAACTDVNWLEHADAVLVHLVAMADDLGRFLRLPTSSSGRHRFTRQGRQQAIATAGVGYRLFDSVATQHLVRIGLLTEALKTAGLSETECSRIHQFERFLEDACENLRVIKCYRSPEALRTFARLFIFVLPPLYAPSFAQAAIDLDSLGMGIVFSVVTTIALGAIFESIEVLEDPFVGSTLLDGIDVQQELHVLHWQQLVNTRELIFPDAPYDVPSAIKPAVMATLRNIRNMKYVTCTTNTANSTTPPLEGFLDVSRHASIRFSASSKP